MTHSTCLIGVHMTYFSPEKDRVSRLVDIAPLVRVPHAWFDPETLDVIGDIEPLLVFPKQRVTQHAFPGRFIQDVALLKLVPMGIGYDPFHLCDLGRALEEAGVIETVLGEGSLLVLYRLGQWRLSRRPRPEEGSRHACSFVTMWEFHPGSPVTFLGTLDLDWDTGRTATGLADGLKRLLADSGTPLPPGDAARVPVARAETYLRHLAIDPRWSLRDIQAQLRDARESLGAGATPEQIALLRDLAQRFGLDAQADEVAD